LKGEKSMMRKKDDKGKTTLGIYQTHVLVAVAVAVAVAVVAFITFILWLIVVVDCEHVPEFNALVGY
jgi:hypothetical protein